MPFENLGVPDDEYFAAGITDEITARLAGVDGLSIIARQSAVRYKNTDKTPQQIGDELGVDYLLEATISWQKSDTGPSRVRVRPQLIRTADASHIWAAIYDDDLTEVFAVQASIAGQVVEALGLALLEPERRELAERPTDNLEAYDYYLRGNDYFGRPVSQDNHRLARRMYETALDLDPTFAHAAAALSRVHSRTFWYFYDRTEERQVTAQLAADSALSLDPDLPEAHQALGEFHYRIRGDYDRALAEFAVARQGRRDDSELLLMIGAVQRRQGRWEEATRNMTRAAELEPRAATYAVQAGHTFLLRRDYEEAERHFSRAISFAPDEQRPYVWMAWVALSASADTATARMMLREAERADPRALDPQVWWHWALYRILDGTSQDLMDRLVEIRVDSAFRFLETAGLHRLLHRPASMRTYFDSARVVLERRLAAFPDEPRFLSELGLAYAGLGRRDEAIQAGERAVKLGLPHDRILGGDWLRNLAEIYTVLDMPEAALERLGELLSIESWASPNWLRLDPIWRPLRDHPRFRQLVGGTD